MPGRPGAPKTASTRTSGRHGAPASRGIHEGVVSVHRSGFGFVRVDRTGDTVFLPPGQVAGLLTGDRVRVKVSHDNTGRAAGRVEDILNRGVTAFLGTVESQGRSLLVHSADRRIALSCHVSAADAGSAKAGDWVIARILKYPTPGTAGTARIERRLDPDRPLELACETAIARHALPVDFPPDVLAEAERYGEHVDPQESRHRVDLRELPLVTIDGEDARDFDDAVYAEPHEKGFRLIVAIADVSHYVRPGTALDAEARKRGTSVYFPNRVLPMLPVALSDRLCSLAPEVDRLCMVSDMILTKDGQLREARHYAAVMRSHARLTYASAHAALFAAEPAAIARLGTLLPRLRPLVDVYRALLKARRRRGALDLEGGEAKFVFDDAGRVREVSTTSRNEAHKLIEECMICANVAVAAELRRTRSGALFRVHAVPEAKKLDQMVNALAGIGVEARLPESVTTRDLRAIPDRVGDATLRGLVEQLVVRSMPQALYQGENIGHFGLALPEYAHFTSPIRRYPDLVVHRALRASIDARDPTGARYEAPELALLGEQLSALERRADEADRYVDAFLKCSYLRERVGQTFPGMITSVVEFGCFVRLDGLWVDGLLHLDALRDDEYRMDDRGTAWVGRRTRRRLELGSHLRVIVTNANPIEGLVDLELTE